jgi:hypothetical protein
MNPSTPRHEDPPGHIPTMPLSNHIRVELADSDLPDLQMSFRECLFLQRPTVVVPSDW